MEWYESALFVTQSYRNYYYGAFQILKVHGYDAEPFWDLEATAERLVKCRLVYLPNASCLSEAQCSTLASYVEGGGTLLATHLTSLADELEKLRHNYGLANLFGAALNSPEPVEIPDLHLCILPSGKLIPQDPQVVLFHATLGSGSEVIAKTFDGGHPRTVGLAVITRRHGHMQVIYIGSGFEAVYEETLDEWFRTYCHSLLDPILMPTRTDEVEFRPGLMSKFDSLEDTTVVHLIVIIPATSGRSVWCRSPFCRSRMCEWASGSPRATLRSPQPCCGARRLPPGRFEMAGSSWPFPRCTLMKLSAWISAYET